jgi:hypothetical protein
LKYILDFVVGIPPTAGYSCFVKDKPEIVGIPPTPGYSRVENNPEVVGENNPVGNRLMAG